MKQKIGMNLMCICVFIFLFFLIINKFFQEKRENFDTFQHPHNDAIVNMPFHTSTTCHNPCTPKSTCYMTGEQCMRDTDCHGCVPNPYKSEKYIDNHVDKTQASLYGELQFMQKQSKHNDLTHNDDTTIFAQPYNSTPSFTRPPQYSLGTNEWKSVFDTSYQLFDERFKPNPSQFKDMLAYPDQYTLSGEFKTDETLPYNY